MKRFQKFLICFSLTILILSFSIYILRGWLFRHFVTYESIGQRSIYSATNKELLDYYINESKAFHPDNVQDIIELSLVLTSHKLNFTKEKNEVDPNKLFKSKNAHCVGYSEFFTTTCNYLLSKYGYSDKWLSRPLIGQVYFCGLNLNVLLKSSFFKDHDFDVIGNTKTNEKYYVDPTLYEYLNIDYVTLR